MVKKIKRRAPKEGAHDLSDLHPVIARVYQARGVASLQDIERTLQHLHDWQGLKGIHQAATLLADAMAKGLTICIMGDFDADGATSTALMIRCLKAMGHDAVHFMVPNRFEHRYGLSEAVVDVAMERYAPDMLVTVDNGIACLDGVAYAKSKGLQVIITDHHLPGDELPDADAIVNPNQPGCSFPSKYLSGVGVAFYTMIALRATLRERGWFEERGIPFFNLAQVLDLVALGTVADVVSLDANNRLLVHHGLERLRRGQGCAGIHALLAVSNRDSTHLQASDLGFAVAPRLNAAGRLEDMSVGIACLLTDDVDQADLYADRLNELNVERRQIESKMQQSAMNIVRSLDLEDDVLPMGVCLYDPEWHQGVIGIVAARVKEKLHRPVAVFTQVNERELKGSVRSIWGVHVRDVLAQVDALNPGIIVSFGGHASAAGLTVHADKWSEFSQAFDEEVQQALEGQMPEQWIETDGPLEAEDLNLELAQMLRESGPWGQGFPEPSFDGRFEVLEQRLVGERHLKLLLKPMDGSQPVAGIYFNVDLDRWPDEEMTTAHVAYKLDVNEYRGRTMLQLVVQHMMLAEATEMEMLA